MSDIKQQIFQELESLESYAMHLRADAMCASKQTDGFRSGNFDQTG